MAGSRFRALNDASGLRDSCNRSFTMNEVRVTDTIASASGQQCCIRSCPQHWRLSVPNFGQLQDSLPACSGRLTDQFTRSGPNALLRTTSAETAKEIGLVGERARARLHALGRMLQVPDRKLHHHATASHHQISVRQLESASCQHPLRRRCLRSRSHRRSHHSPRPGHTLRCLSVSKVSRPPSIDFPLCSNCRRRASETNAREGQPQ
jgi:hypothetical protein